MKRPATIVGIFLASFSQGSHGRSIGSVPSYVQPPPRAAGIGIGPRDAPGKARFDCACDGPRRRGRTICRMNKNKLPSYFSRPDDEGGEAEEADEGSTGKRGVFRRLRQRMSTAFGGARRGGEADGADGGSSSDAGYRPGPLDALRLRLATAMSGLNPFRVGDEEWVVACPKTRVGPGQIVPCVVNGLDVIIFASRDGQRLDAFANACPHLGSPFDLATIERKPVLQDRGRSDDGTGDGCVDCIVCPVHRTAFEIQSGRVRGEWCPYPPIIGGVMGYVKPKNDLVKFAVRLRGKNVEVRIATSVDKVGRKEECADGMRGIK